MIVEYALKTANKPIGVAEYQLTGDLPKELNGVLPTPQDLRNMIGNH